MKTLYKTTIVVWSEYDPTIDYELTDLVREADSGSAYCSVSKTELVDDVEKDADWDGTEFFDMGDDEDEGY